MSFTTEVKDELSTLELTNIENLSLLSGFIRNNIKVIEDKIILSTENNKIARKIYSLIKQIYEINPTITQAKGANFSKKNIYVIEIFEKIDEINNDLSISENGVILDHPKEYIIQTEDQIRSYLRGAFLSSGSINDPKTSRYHLEFYVSRKEEAITLINLLSGFNIIAKYIERDNGFMVYVKEAEKIGDFLRILSVNRAVMYYEDIRIYRDHKNMTNRLNNCEQANVDKIIASSQKQIRDINKIFDKLEYDLIDPKLVEVMEYRIKYPEVSLDELSRIISIETQKNLSKSGLNHRMRKIHELAERLDQ